MPTPLAPLLRPSCATHVCPVALRQSLDEVARLLGTGAVGVNVSHKLSLGQAPEAFQIMLNRQVGRRVLASKQASNQGKRLQEGGVLWLRGRLRTRRPTHTPACCRC